MLTGYKYSNKVHKSNRMFLECRVYYLGNPALPGNINFPFLPTQLGISNPS